MWIAPMQVLQQAHYKHTAHSGTQQAERGQAAGKLLPYESKRAVA